MYSQFQEKLFELIFLLALTVKNFNLHFEDTLEVCLQWGNFGFKSCKPIQYASGGIQSTISGNSGSRTDFGIIFRFISPFSAQLSSPPTHPKIQRCPHKAQADKSPAPRKISAPKPFLLCFTYFISDKDVKHTCFTSSCFTFFYKATTCKAELLYIILLYIFIDSRNL
mgnify:CR=1 FL=1